LVEFRILGPLQVTDAGSVIPVGGPRHRKLLAVLLVHADQVVSPDRLIDALWGEHPPSGARRMVHVRISELRRELRGGAQAGDAGIVTQSSGYQLHVSAEALDARRFEGLVVAGRQALDRGDHVGANQSLAGALGLWRGPPLPEVADEEFARPEIARLEALYHQALEARMDVMLALGRAGDAVVELKALVAEHPLRERFWHQLMLAQYRTDRQGEALETYRAVRTVLVEQLGVEPGSELQHLHAAILQQDPGLDVPGARSAEPVGEPPNNLPGQLTTFVGREAEMVELVEGLRKSRLITLVGVGGVGKSRLALEVAARSLADHRGGTWLIELAALTQPGLVAPALATTLGVREHPERPLVDLLADHLGAADVLLVLDNCERLLDEVAQLAQRLLQACTGLSILATSRERLGITGEALSPLSGLGVPQPHVSDPREVETADAARLLVDRAAAVRPDFQLDASTAGAVTEICRRLDGLPLAIELAAARVNALEVEQIAARLNDRFRLLSQGERTAASRHQTLRAVVDWSYGLLSDPERRLFERVSVFVGGFTLDAAQAVGGPSHDGGNAALSVIWRLVDKSLILSEQSAVPSRRYRMLETLRAYGFDRLDERGELAQLRERHAKYFLVLAEPAGDALRGPAQSAWLDRLEIEHGNLRAALEWSLEQTDAEMAVRLAGSLYAFWDLHGHYREGRRWLAQALALEGQVSPAARARALMGSATLAVIQGDLEGSATACEEAAELSTRAGDAAGLAHALQYLGVGAIFADELDRAAELLDASLKNARVAGDAWLEGWALTFLAATALAGGATDRAVGLAAESEAVSHPGGDPECVAWALLIGAMASWSRDDHVRAVEVLRRALIAFRELDAPWGLSLGLVVSALSAGTRGDAERLVRLMGASERMRSSIGAAVLPFIEVSVHAAISQAKEALGDDAFDRAWQAGEALTTDGAVGEALRELDLAAPSSAPIGNGARS
jgi:predicted ATPase/DNA-binding SARP family transcriptional activator